MIDGITNRRRNQVFVLKSVGLRGRWHRTNSGRSPSDGLDLPNGAEHMWACPGCGSENSPHYLSCRKCQALKWGVAP